MNNADIHKLAFELDDTSQTEEKVVVFEEKHDEIIIEQTRKDNDIRNDKSISSCSALKTTKKVKSLPK